MALEHPQMMTVEEYFHLEETDTENRYEYIDGLVYMMAGGTFDHSTISGTSCLRFTEHLFRLGEQCFARPR